MTHFARALVACLLLWNLVVGEAADYYKELGVRRNASPREIKKAFRKKAVKWHPDKNPDRPLYAAKKMQRLNEAYETLSDVEKRRAYDWSAESVESHEQGGSFGGGGATFHSGGFPQSAGTFGAGQAGANMDFGDILGDILRQMAGSGRRTQGRGKPSYDIRDFGAMFDHAGGGGQGWTAGGASGRRCSTTTTCMGSTCTTRTTCS